VNLIEHVTFTCAVEWSLDMFTLFGYQFEDLFKIWSLRIKVGSAVAVDVESLRYFRESTRRVTAGAVGFLC